MNSIPTRKFQDLIVWQKAHGFVLEVYRLTKQFPKSELYGLTLQMRRAAVSIPANIAEGYNRWTRKMSIKQDVREACILGWGWHQADSLRLAGEGSHPPPRKMVRRDFLRGYHKRRTKPDKIRLFNIAQASLEECRYYLILAKDLEYGETTVLPDLCEEISKMLAAYIGSLQTPGS